MATPAWLLKLKQRWNLQSVGQVIVVLIVFACTGMTVVKLKDPLLGFFAGDAADTVLASVIYYLLILPIYNVFLLAYGFLFGQFSFFWEFEKKSFNRLISVFKRTKK